MKRIGPDQVTGIVLAGGAGSRMGGDKGMMKFNGIPLIQYAIRTLQSICSQIIISTNSTRFGEKGYWVQPDIIPGKGPLGGIYSSLYVSRTEHNLILPCDTPRVTKKLLTMLLENCHGYQVVIPISKPGHPEPLIGYYNRNNLTAMLSYLESNKLRLTDYIESTLHLTIPVYKNPEVYNPEIFMNINSPNDMEGQSKQADNDRFL